MGAADVDPAGPVLAEAADEGRTFAPGSDLTGIDLAGADLTGANLTGCILRDANLDGADLSGVSLIGADLAGANLSNVTGHRAIFGQADLSDAVLFGADLTEATFSRSSLRGADLRGTTLTGCRFREADLSRSDLSKANLQEADLTLAKLDHASFHDADLRHARLRAASGFATTNWIGVDIVDVDFAGAYLLRREIMDQNYLFEFRHRSRINELVYWIWWITSDCGRSIGRWALWTVGMAVIFAFAYSFVDVDFGQYQTGMSPFYYSVVTLTTLGYGDVVPASQGAQFVAMVEVIIGYVMLGGLLSIFATKMGRRAE